MLPRRLGHRKATLAHERDCLLRVHHRRCRESGELSDGRPDDVIRAESAGTQDRQDGQTRGDQRRLLYLGLHQLLERRLEAQAPQVEVGRLARLLEDFHRLGERLGQLAAHSLLERSLSWKTESDFRHRGPPFVHSIKPEPHVRPAPIPVIRTSSPARSLPSASASTRARGIEPDDVLPYRSTFTTTRSGGLPSFWTA